MKSAVAGRYNARKVWVALCIVVTLVTLGANARAATDAPDNRWTLCFEPGDWVGKYPAEKTAGRSRFIDLPCIRAPLKALLPVPEFKRLIETLQVDSPIRMVGQYLIVARCEAHACPADHAMIVIDLERGDLVVGLYRRSASGSVTRWYSNGRDPLELPPEIPQQFLRQHTPAP